MVSKIAVDALKFAYATNLSGERTDPTMIQSILEEWEKHNFLDSDAVVRRLGKYIGEDIAALNAVGIEVPLWLPHQLNSFFRNIEAEIAARKRQSTAVPSDKADLAAVLANLKIEGTMNFEARPDFVNPEPEAVEKALWCIGRSLFTKELLAPEQPAREFLSQCKPFLPDSYFNEVKLTGKQVKRCDTLVISADRQNKGLIELKKHLPMYGQEFRFALAQIAVYAAAAGVQTDHVRFVILMGFQDEESASARAVAGLCLFAKDREGQQFVKQIDYEASTARFHMELSDDGGLDYKYAKFVKILQRLHWVGGGSAGAGVVVNATSDVVLSDEEA